MTEQFHRFWKVRGNFAKFNSGKISENVTLNVYKKDNKEKFPENQRIFTFLNMLMKV